MTTEHRESSPAPAPRGGEAELASRVRLAEDMLFATLYSVSDGVIITDPTACVTQMNPIAEGMTGWIAADARGRRAHHVFRLIEEDTRAALDDLAERALVAQDAVGPIEGLLTPWDGRERPVQAGAVPVRGAGGMGAVVLTFRDVSRERRSRAALQRSQDELRHMIEHLPDGILMARGEEFVYANPAMAAFLGYPSAADLVGKRPGDLLAPEDAGLPRAPAAATPSREWRFVRHDGTPITLEASGGLRIEFEGQQNVLWAFRDVSERKQLQVQLMQADRMASIGTLAAGVAHEINNPLAYVIANLEYVDRASWPLSTARRRPASPATSRRAEGGARGRRARPPHRARPQDLLPRRRGRSGPVDPAAGARVRRQHGRATRSATARGCARTTARRRSWRQRGAAGPGVPQPAHQRRPGHPGGGGQKNQIRADRQHERGRRGDHRGERHRRRHAARGPCPRIFDPFFTTKPIGVGTGLGLSICQSIVHKLGGRIDVQSAVGEGTAFRLALPPARPGGETEVPQDRPRAPAVRRARILVVDDEAAIGVPEPNQRARCRSSAPAPAGL